MNPAHGYLPKEAENSIIGKSILRTLWSNKVIVNSLGLRNENEAREWFRNNPHVHEAFENMNKELELKILELQKRATCGLQNIVAQERHALTALQKLNSKVIQDLDPDIDENPLKRFRGQ